MKPEYPNKPLSLEYNHREFLREAEAIHKRLNNLIVSPAIAALEATNAAYAAGDVGSAANIAIALNVLAAAVNLQTTAINTLLDKLNAT